MASPEGEGRAKTALEAAYETYYKANKSVNKRIFAALPELREILRGYAGSRLLDLYGFWVMWHACGGFDGTQKALGISKSQMYRRIALFREVFGEHPDVCEFPGLTINPAEFLAGMAERSKRLHSK
ncbi:MAG: hypothetical protein EAS51_02070 [Microbacteriaceae bacterium]|nr:MAG: hypothetical protein EAS51_02070 [Microbacteriaceae bacterium]